MLQRVTQVSHWELIERDKGIIHFFDPVSDFHTDNAKVTGKNASNCLFTDRIGNILNQY